MVCSAQTAAATPRTRKWKFPFSQNKNSNKEHKPCKRENKVNTGPHADGRPDHSTIIDGQRFVPGEAGEPLTCAEGPNPCRRCLSRGAALCRDPPTGINVRPGLLRGPGAATRQTERQVSGFYSVPAEPFTRNITLGNTLCKLSVYV